MLLDEIGPFEAYDYADEDEDGNADVIEYGFLQKENSRKKVVPWNGSVDIDTRTGLVKSVFAMRNKGPNKELVIWDRDRGFQYGQMKYKEYVFVVLIKLHQKFPQEITADSYSELFRKLRRTSLLEKYPPIAIAPNRSHATVAVDEARAVTLRMREESKQREAFLNEGMLGHDAAVAKFLTNKNKRTRRSIRKK